ncbi:MAG: dipeptide/oligopeptide/nickel ABC transporter permease/ATP-binding protein [Solirubrobacteraceae bacterium]
MRRNGWLMRTARAFVASPGGVAAAVGVGAIVVLAIVGPIIWGGHAANAENFAELNASPSSNHLLGTDLLGRDVLDRTLSATRLSLELGVAATAISLGVGFPIGALVAMLGPRLRGLGRSAIATMLSFPSLLLAIVIVAILGVGPESAVIAVGVGGVPYFARIAESLASSTVAQDYVSSARVIGVPRRRLLARHVMPNIGEPLTIAGLTSVSESIVEVSALSFLGLGVQAPAYDWGSLLTSGVQELYLVPTAALGPAVMIGLTALLFTLLGESLVRALNPRLWSTETRAALRTRHRRLLRWRGPEQARPRRPTITGGDGGGDGVLLHVEDLTVTLPTPTGDLTPVRGISFDAGAGEVVGIVGESGSGKTLTALSIAQLLPYPARFSARSLAIAGQDVLELGAGRLRSLLGSGVAMIFQDPMTSLNPAMRVGPQLTDGARRHRGLKRREASALASKLLGEVNIAQPSQAMRCYPFEFSGGMRQRAMIAMGLMTEPKLLIADEPTTALDVTVQSQVLDLLDRINRDHGTTILLISHSIGVVSSICRRVLVMYAGRIVEDLDVETLAKGPSHPYTQALMAAVPRLDDDRSRPLAGIPGQPWRLGEESPGCAFAPRCPHALERCRVQQPDLLERQEGHRVACWAVTARADLVGSVAGE